MTRRDLLGCLLWPVVTAVAAVLGVLAAWALVGRTGWAGP